MSFETDNTKEEIKEIVQKCIRCGMCKSLCPVLRVLREEQYSPRGQAVMLDNNYFERLVYDCTLCKACEKECPLGLNLCKAFIKARTVVINQKRELPENREIIDNMNKSGNIFGIEDKGDN